MDAITKLASAIDTFSNKGMKQVVVWDIPTTMYMLGGILVVGIALITFAKKL